MQFDISSNKVTSLSNPIMFFGFLCGLLLSLGVLSGDESGRVNLLYLLLVYLFIPLFGAILAIASLAKGKGLNIARVLSTLPIWSKPQKLKLLQIRQQNVDKYWFFLQSQVAALAYSVASLLTFSVLLLATDINFVWRSTLLNAEQLQPLLSFVALPWWFWEQAQPTSELLRMTQDSRLIDNYSNTGSFGNWWAFVLATQLVYSFILRGGLLAFASMLISKKLSKEAKKPGNKTQKRMKQVPETHTYASLVHSLPYEYTLCNWAAFEQNIVEQLSISPNKTLKEGPRISLDNKDKNNQPLLILVKAWEPPMGELQDFMQNGNGLIFPINLKNKTTIAIEEKHLKEWQRFVALLPNWSIYLPAPMGVQQ